MPTQRRLVRAVLFVAITNLSYFLFEFGVALTIGSVALFADAIDFLEDAAINFLILIALGWSALNRARLGKAMSLMLLLPAGFAIWQGVEKFFNPSAPAFAPLAIAAVAGLAVNLTAALTLVRFRKTGGAIVLAAWLFSRNDALVNIAILAMAFVTLYVQNGWPDLILGLGILLLNLDAAKKVWQASKREGLEARYLEHPDSAANDPTTT